MQGLHEREACFYLRLRPQGSSVLGGSFTTRGCAGGLCTGRVDQLTLVSDLRGGWSWHPPQGWVSIQEGHLGRVPGSGPIAESLPLQAAPQWCGPGP